MRPQHVTVEEFERMTKLVRSSVEGHARGARYSGLARPALRSCKPVSSPASSPSFHYEFSLMGQVPSGKNQVQLLWRNGKVHRYPNKTFTNWRTAASVDLLSQPRPQEPLNVPIRLTCDYWPGNLIVRDLSGQLDALFSLLVYARILRNDGLVYACLWRRYEVTRFPKLLMELEPWNV